MAHPEVQTILWKMKRRRGLRVGQRSGDCHRERGRVGVALHGRANGAQAGFFVGRPGLSLPDDEFLAQNGYIDFVHLDRIGG